VLAYNQKGSIDLDLFKRISLNDSPPHAAHMTQIELVVKVDGQSQTERLSSAQTLCITISDELYVEIAHRFDAQENLCPQPLLTPCNNNF
jgi:hypothetical protein